MSEFDCDLLVIGLGPVGDALCALARIQGLTVIGIERSPDLHPYPRSAVIDEEIMRILQMVGIADVAAREMRVVDRYQFLTANGEVLLDFPMHSHGPYGWAESYAIHQPTLERALRDRMDELGADVRTDVAFVGLEQDDRGVTVATRTAGVAGSIRARYVVGCDGGASPVRQALGIDLFDYGFDEPWLVLDVKVEPEHAPPMVVNQICDPKRPVTHIALNHGRFRWEFMLRPGESPEEFASDESIRELIAPWVSADHIQIERKAIYNFHALVANEWRRGRVLIAGDAAHQMPPFAGQGMCSGIRDAVNLAWKLEAVIHRGSSQDILDSYQEERSPHVRAIIETAIAMGRVVCLQDEVAAAGRDAEMLARKAAGGQDVGFAFPDLVSGLLNDTPKSGALIPQPSIDDHRLDDILGHEAALLGRNLPSHTSVQTLDLDDAKMAPFATSIDDWLQEVGATSVLVRPDRHVFGTGDAQMLLHDWAAKLGAKIAA